MIEKTVVLALGNPLRGDDGVGTAVLQALAEYALPPHVTLIDGGTPGLETTLLLEGAERAIIVDAADMGLAPGAWRCFAPHEVMFGGGDSFQGTLHSVGLAEALRLGDALHILPPQIEIVGVQPADVGWEAGLSAAVTAVVRPVADYICELLQWETVATAA